MGTTYVLKIHPYQQIIALFSIILRYLNSTLPIPPEVRDSRLAVLKGSSGNTNNLTLVSSSVMGLIIAAKTGVEDKTAPPITETHIAELSQAKELVLLFIKFINLFLKLFQS
jgi:hypothetical protein